MARPKATNAATASDGDGTRQEVRFSGSNASEATPAHCELQPSLFVYSGRDLLGHVIEHAPARHEVIDAAGKIVGTFTTRSAAVRALAPVHREAQR